MTQNSNLLWPLIVLGLGLIAACGPKPDADKKAEAGPAIIHWTYEGEGGPEQWSQLGGPSKICGPGLRQSPIDVVAPTRTQGPQLAFNYMPAAVSIQNQGHSVLLTPNKAGGIDCDGVTYTLKEIQLHTPSEHALSGHKSAFEVQFYHQDSKGHVLAVAVLSDVGNADPMLASVMAYVPPTPGPKTLLPDLLINARDLMPVNEDFIAYSGSLTRPPCSEGVTWLVFTQKLTLSPEQVGTLGRAVGANARPLQERHDRDLIAIH